LGESRAACRRGDRDELLVERSTSPARDRDPACKGLSRPTAPRCHQVVIPSITTRKRWPSHCHNFGSRF
jgi:hypothetical protein